jgi:hypothetical protein
MKPLTLSILALLLTACTTPAPRHVAGAADAEPKTETKLTDIATTPLSDLNLVRSEIPAVLQAARKKPYDLPEAQGCATLAANIQAIDEVLGADLDVPPTPSDPGLIERGYDFAGDAAIGAARGAAEGIVPFRSWVRKLSGAERHSREVAAAIAAGSIRRAFLKGLGQAAGCQPPAAPHPQPEQGK